MRFSKNSKIYGNLMCLWGIYHEYRNILNVLICSWREAGGTKMYLLIIIRKKNYSVFYTLHYKQRFMAEADSQRTFTIVSLSGCRLLPSEADGWKLLPMRINGSTWLKNRCNVAKYSLSDTSVSSTYSIALKGQCLCIWNIVKDRPHDWYAMYRWECFPNKIHLRPQYPIFEPII